VIPYEKRHPVVCHGCFPLRTYRGLNFWLFLTCQGEDLQFLVWTARRYPTRHQLLWAYWQPTWQNAKLPTQLNYSKARSTFQVATKQQYTFTFIYDIALGDCCLHCLLDLWTSMLSTLLLVVGKIYVKSFSVALLSPLPAFITTFSLLRESSHPLHVLYLFKNIQEYNTRTSRCCSFINYSPSNIRIKWLTLCSQSTPCSLSYLRYLTFYPFLYTIIVTCWRMLCSLRYHNMFTGSLWLLLSSCVYIACFRPGSCMLFSYSAFLLPQCY